MWQPTRGAITVENKIAFKPTSFAGFARASIFATILHYFDGRFFLVRLGLICHLRKVKY
jgi:hypothetical protein